LLGHLLLYSLFYFLNSLSGELVVDTKARASSRSWLSEQLVFCIKSWMIFCVCFTFARKERESFSFYYLAVILAQAFAPHPTANSTECG
jgi:sorbitol-specific phosphotransferase system component IIC